MTQRHTNFSVGLNGLPIVNHFEVSFDIPLPFMEGFKLKDYVYGLCGGMCFAALDYYHAGRPLPELPQADELRGKFLRYLIDRQMDSLGLTVVPRVIEWMLQDDGDVAVRTVKNEIPKMRRKLDEGKPVVLALIRARLGESPTRNHQVLATGYTLEKEGRQMMIELYDPNHPGMQPTLTLDLNDPRQGIYGQQSTGEPFRGFFVIGYRRKKPPQVD